MVCPVEQLSAGFPLLIGCQLLFYGHQSDDLEWIRMFVDNNHNTLVRDPLTISGPDEKGHITVSGPLEEISRTVLELAENMQTAGLGEPWCCTCELDGRNYEIHPELPKDAISAASYKCYRETGLRSFTKLRPGRC
jgi:hypothetical protein